MRRSRQDPGSCSNMNSPVFSGILVSRACDGRHFARRRIVYARLLPRPFVITPDRPKRPLRTASSNRLGSAYTESTQSMRSLPTAGVTVGTDNLLCRWA
ncbi:hypothetical protein FF011L_23030 [Roseimaritima multifibrata]|uniref:Uncharacterized protein n=1 Tax=Roseimaritima multifibrata TaxID=1930274 RepID=A0A517MF72_9BACT|nr:hypothetical protein FF011L_23030 [Roseimaritima multifibrata]